MKNIKICLFNSLCYDDSFIVDMKKKNLYNGFWENVAKELSLVNIFLWIVAIPVVLIEEGILWYRLKNIESEFPEYFI